MAEIVTKTRRGEGGEKMKKRTVIPVIFFLIASIVFGLFSLSWAKKTEKVTPRDSGGLKTPLIRSPWIRGIRIGTEADGRWYWEATIKNNERKPNRTGN